MEAAFPFATLRTVGFTIICSTLVLLFQALQCQRCGTRAAEKIGGHWERSADVSMETWTKTSFGEAVFTVIL